MFEPAIAAFEQPWLWRKQEERPQRNLSANAALHMGMPPAKRFSGRADHLQRASNPAAVRRGKACRAFAVFLLQGEISLCHGKRPDLCSDAGINLRNGRDAVKQRPDRKSVEWGKGGS